MSQNVVALPTNQAAREAASTLEETGVALDSVVLHQMLEPLSQYLVDDAVRELAVPAPGKIFLLVGGHWQERTDEALSFDYMKALAAAMAGFNEGAGFQSIMSLKLLNGMRGQIMLPPVTLEGTISLNIRKHSSIVKNLEELAQEGALHGWRDVSGAIQHPELLNPVDLRLHTLLQDRQIKEFLEEAVQARKNILIAGRTGSGKTTFARSLIQRVSQSERLITIEDVHELFLPDHPNKVNLIYGTGVGQATPTECLAACMRSSPDRIFLSELRGPEAWDYLQALNTGHPGSVTTTHANGALDGFHRVMLLIKQSEAGQQIDLDTLHRFLLSTLDIVLYFSSFKLVEVYFNPERAQSVFK